MADPASPVGQLPRFSPTRYLLLNLLPPRVTSLGADWVFPSLEFSVSGFIMVVGRGGGGRSFKSTSSGPSRGTPYAPLLY